MSLWISPMQTDKFSRKGIATITMVLGILTMSGAFFIDHANRFPTLMKYLSPKYVKSKHAFRTLKRGETITPSTSGAKILSALFKNKVLKPNNPSQIHPWINQAKVSRIRLSQSRELNTKQGWTRPVYFKLGNRDRLQWSEKDLRNTIHDLRRKDLWFWSKVIFGLGILVELVGFILGTFF